MSNKALVPEANQGLNAFKNEVAMELGVPFKEYNADLTSRQSGSVGGEMDKRMVEQYERGIRKATTVWNHKKRSMPWKDGNWNGWTTKKLIYHYKREDAAMHLLLL